MNEKIDEERHSMRSHRDKEWAVILAGGDGIRLKPLTRKIAGDDRPKQFCPVLGGAALIEETRRRAALELAGERTLYVLNRQHERYYAPILDGEPRENLIVQPSNRGTAPAIRYSLLRIAARAPDAIAAFFPSDHYISDNSAFMAHVRVAIETARHRPDLIVLLGLEPENPEVEYGWIEPSAAIRGQRKVYGVRRFWEKPNKMLAQALQLRGCLWNSFVMVGSVRAMLDSLESAAPFPASRAGLERPPKLVPSITSIGIFASSTFLIRYWRSGPSAWRCSESAASVGTISASRAACSPPSLPPASAPTGSTAPCPNTRRPAAPIPSPSEPETAPLDNTRIAPTQRRPALLPFAVLILHSPFSISRSRPASLLSPAASNRTKRMLSA